MCCGLVPTGPGSGRQLYWGERLKLRRGPQIPTGPASGLIWPCPNQRAGEGEQGTPLVSPWVTLLYGQS